MRIGIKFGFEIIGLKEQSHIEIICLICFYEQQSININIQQIIN